MVLEVGRVGVEVVLPGGLLFAGDGIFEGVEYFGELLF